MVGPTLHLTLSQILLKTQGGTHIFTKTYKAFISAPFCSIHKKLPKF